MFGRQFGRQPNWRWPAYRLPRASLNTKFGGPSHTELEHPQVQRRAPGCALYRGPSVSRGPGSRSCPPVHGGSRAGSNGRAVGRRRAISEREDHPTKVRQLSSCGAAGRPFLRLASLPAGLGMGGRRGGGRQLHAPPTLPVPVDAPAGAGRLGRGGAPLPRPGRARYGGRRRRGGSPAGTADLCAARRSLGAKVGSLAAAIAACDAVELFVQRARARICRD